MKQTLKVCLIFGPGHEFTDQIEALVSSPGGSSIYTCKMALFSMFESFQKCSAEADYVTPLNTTSEVIFVTVTGTGEEVEW